MELKTLVFDRRGESAAAVAGLLLEGKVGVIPADTIYGISAMAVPETAERIFEVKRRPANKNLITLTTKRRLRESGLEVPEAVMAAWPCPLTAILPDGKGGTVAVRCPSDSYIREIVRIAGPIWSTSANISGEAPCSAFTDLWVKFAGSLDFIVRKKEEEEGASALPSTLLDCSTSPWRILRQGAYDASGLI